jgi:hypothetical protein
MPSHISPAQIKAELDRIIEDANSSEPKLGQRLSYFYRWIKDKKPGLLVKKRLVLDLIIEVMLDAKLWLNIKDLNDAEKVDFYNAANLSCLDIYWYEILFPTWFNNSDPKSSIWTQKLMSEEFPRDDLEFIAEFIKKFKTNGAVTLYKYILDLSMATDLAISYNSKKPLLIQFTISNPNLLTQKRDEWEKTLRYWKIERGVLFSQSPSHSIDKSVSSLLAHSDELENNCYIVSVSEA